MPWMADVEARLGRGNAILFRKTDPIIARIADSVAGKDRRVQVMWALDLAEETASALARCYPDDVRPIDAVRLSRLWASGEVKMPAARRAILNVHAMARDVRSPEHAALCHAVGQACGVVHAAGHAPGYPIYELTALVRRHGLHACRAPIEARVAEYEAGLMHWEETIDSCACAWAGFIAPPDPMRSRSADRPDRP